jgi:hypothetical protein
MIEELQLGFAGYCPTVGFADIYQQVYELYQAGKPQEAFDMYGRILAFQSFTHADQYLMAARGIFKENTKSRHMPGMGDPNSKPPAPLTEGEKKDVLKTIDTYLKPYMRG